MSKEKANEKISIQSSSTGSKKSQTGFIVAFATIAVCAVLGIVLFVAFGKDAKATKYNRVVTPDNVDEIVENLASTDVTPIGSYETTMNSNWTFPDGESVSSNAYVENSVNNQSTVYFTLALRDSPNEIIFTSPDLPVGSHLEDIKLDTPLDAGVYDAIITYHLVDDNHTEASSVSVSLTITIEK
jgi:hypothetical protein